MASQTSSPTSGSLQRETFKAFRSVSANLVLKGASFVAGFLFQILYARQLGAGGLSRIALAMSVISLATVLCNLSMDAALVRFAPRFRHTGEFAARLGGYLSFSIRITVPLALAGALVFTVGRAYLSRKISPGADISYELLCLAPLLVLSVWSMQEGGAMRANEDFVQYSITNDFLPRILQGFAYVGVGYFLVSRENAWLAAYALSVAVPLVMKIVIVRRSLGTHQLLPRSEVGPEAKREVLAFSLKTIFYSLLSTSMAQSARLLLGVFGAAEGAGIYMVIESLSIVLLFIRDAMGTVLNPQVARLYAQGQEAMMISLYRRLSRWALLICMPYSLVLMLNSHAVLGLYGTAFANGASALVVLITAQFVVVVMGLNGNLLYMSGGENFMVSLQTASLGTMLLLGCVLIPRYGMVGGAMAMGVATVSMSCLLLWRVKRRFKVTQFDRRTWRTLAVCLSDGAFVWVWTKQVHFIRPGALDLVVKVLLAYAVCAAATALLDRREEDREIMQSIRERLCRRQGGAGQGGES